MTIDPRYNAIIAAWNAATAAPGTVPSGVTGTPFSAGFTTQQKCDAVNSWTVAGPQQPIIVPTYKIYNAIDPTEWGALNAAQQQQIRDILTMGMVDASVGTNARAVLISVFTGKATTLAALTALAASFKPALLWWQAVGGLTSAVTPNDATAAGLV